VFAKCLEIFGFLECTVSSKCVYVCFGLMFIPAKRHEQVLCVACVSFDNSRYQLNYVHCMRAVSHVGMLSRISWRVAFARSTEFGVFPEYTYNFFCDIFGLYKSCNMMKTSKFEISRDEVLTALASGMRSIVWHDLPALWWNVLPGTLEYKGYYPEDRTGEVFWNVRKHLPDSPASCTRIR